ncbi:pali-domain-containing protein [Ramaria rubella]|nr:pali-domain-containing protein [Ramaria rubella]
MARVFCTFGVVILFAAFILQLLVAISLPFLDSFDIVRVHFNSGNVNIADVRAPISQLRLGVWAFCEDDASSGDRTCDHTGHGYSVGVQGPQNGQVVNIRSGWTRGLAVHPVAAAVIFVALLLSFSTHLTITLIASLVSFLAALITLIAFAIDIALFALTKHEIDNLGGVPSNTDAGPGFWITLATFLLLLIAGCTVCFGRHRDRRAGSASKMTTTNFDNEKRGKRPFWRRWRRNAY